MPTDWQLGFLRIMAIIGAMVAIFLLTLTVKPRLQKVIPPLRQHPVMLYLREWIPIMLMLIFWLGLASIAASIVVTSSHRLNPQTQFCLVFGVIACVSMAVWMLGHVRGQGDE